MRAATEREAKPIKGHPLGTPKGYIDCVGCTVSLFEDDDDAQVGGSCSKVHTRTDTEADADRHGNRYGNRYGNKCRHGPGGSGVTAHQMHTRTHARTHAHM